MENNIGAAVFGAVATLAGVFITHLFAQRRFERQLVFDKEQKSIERMTELRTEVYLDAAARSGQMGGYIVRVQSLVSSNQFRNHDEYDAFMESLNKLSVVAEPETAFQAGETLSAFSSAFSTALTASLKLAVLEMDITKAAERHATAKENWGVALVEMTIASNADDITRTQAAVAKLRSTRDLLRSYTSVHLQLTTERRELLRQYHAMVSDKLLATREPTVALLSRIRKDLGLPTQNARILEQLERQHSVNVAELAVLARAGDELVAARMAQYAAAELEIDKKLANFTALNDEILKLRDEVVKVGAETEAIKAEVAVRKAEADALEAAVAARTAEADALEAELAALKGKAVQ